MNFSFGRSTKSKEFVTAIITADVVLDAQPVELAVIPQSQEDPTDADFVSAAWLEDPGKVRKAVILLDPGLARGTWNVWARVTDDPEVPVFACGRFVIT